MPFPKYEWVSFWNIFGKEKRFFFNLEYIFHKYSNIIKKMININYITEKYRTLSIAQSLKIHFWNRY